MHSTLVRAQNVFGYFTTVVFVVSALIASSVFLMPQTPDAKVAVRSVQVVRGRPHYYSTKKEEYAHIRFDLDADLSSLFTWNTKQVFVYVLARWPSTSSPSGSSSSNTTTTYSEALIWDSIIPSSSLLKTSMVPSHVSGSNSKKAKTAAASSSSSWWTGSASATFAGADDETRPGRLKLRNQKPKYQITDISGKLAERANVTLEARFNVQPWVGLLTWSRTKDVRHGGVGVTAAGRSGRWGRWLPLPATAIARRGPPGTEEDGTEEGFAFPAVKTSAKKN